MPQLQPQVKPFERRRKVFYCLFAIIAMLLLCEGGTRATQTLPPLPRVVCQFAPHRLTSDTNFDMDGGLSVDGGSNYLGRLVADDLESG